MTGYHGSTMRVVIEKITKEDIGILKEY